MYRKLVILTAISLLAGGSALARSVGEAKECRAVCAVEKTECRSQVQTQTLDDTRPMLSMKENNRIKKSFAQPTAGTEQIQPGGASDAFKRRRMERLGVCEDKALSCARACTGPAAESAKVGSPVLTEKK